MRGLVWIGLVAGCAAPGSELDEPQDAIDSGEPGKEDSTCSLARCGAPDAPNILFPGNPVCSGGGCERHLASAELYIPPRGGRPWGDTFALGTDAPVTLAGFSSGRIALLRRLGLVGDGEHAVLLDPSWPDGERDFLGRGPERGEDIVRAWLAADPARTFTLVYSTRSVGWEGYAALVVDGDVGAQVRVCTVDAPHLRVPRVEGIEQALVDPVGWLEAGACRAPE